jgi:hypothetical protein
MKWFNHLQRFWYKKSHPAYGGIAFAGIGDFIIF